MRCKPLKYHAISAEETAKNLLTDPINGLTEKEAAKRLEKFGKNIITEKKKKNIFIRFLEQFNDFMIMLLLGAAAVSFATSLAVGDANVTESAIILAIVVLNALLGTIQEMRAEHSIEALKKLSAPSAAVIRDGKEIRIHSENIVPGDILRIRQGDIVCADCRLIESDGLCVNESVITGETDEIPKNASVICDEFTPYHELANSVMSSSAVTRGNALATVTATGMNTEVGKIASMLNITENIKTPLQKRLADTGKVLGIACLFICGIIFMIGTAKQIPPFEMFMTSVSLAVAAIPEGLPAIVTILLALGVVRMAKRNAIIRSLPSVETLGCATVICTDKTGTLTLNRMRTAEVFSDDPSFLFKLAVLCTEDGTYINPTDRAVLDGAVSYGINPSVLKEKYKKSVWIPFDSSRKRMSVTADSKLIVKGAPELILPLCVKYHENANISSFTAAKRSKVLHENEKMTKSALRVIAVAYKPIAHPEHIPEEDNLIFLGLIGIYDAPRPEAKKAVHTAKKAGIRTIMITGDHVQTALSIAEKTGIATDKVVTGAEIDMTDDAKLSLIVNECSVFARVTPEHKLRIVKALQNNGEICAMTGDGVNDAPALRGADIGCSMGINGTDVAKSASDIILADDNFATIVSAVREGRTIYDNIKKSVKFLMSTNIGEILTVMFGIIFGCSSPLTATQLLWINLVTDSLPAVALGLDPPHEDIMHRPPLNPRLGIFTKGLWAKITLEGLMIGALSLFSHALGLFLTHSDITARTMAFFVLAVSQLTHAFNMRSDDSVIRSGLFKNKYLVLSYALGLLLQILIIYTEPLSALFNICPLAKTELALCILMSVMPLFIVELQKHLNHKFTKK